jgi:hypothetical protein
MTLPPNPDAALAEILGDEYLAWVANSVQDTTDDLRTDNDAAERKELRERLQVLEAWKINAGLEAPLIDDLIWHYRDALGLTEIPTNQHDPHYWDEKREDFKREGP